MSKSLHNHTLAGQPVGARINIRGFSLPDGVRLRLLEMGMPPYRRPSLRVTLTRMWERATVFLRQAGTAGNIRRCRGGYLLARRQNANPWPTPRGALAAAADLPHRNASSALRATQTGSNGWCCLQRRP